MRPAPVITIVGRAAAEGIREAAETVETPGGYQAVQLRVAEQYVEKLGLLAKENDTMIVPITVGDVSSIIAETSYFVRPGSAPSPAGELRLRSPSSRVRSVHLFRPLWSTTCPGNGFPLPSSPPVSAGRRAVPGPAVARRIERGYGSCEWSRTSSTRWPEHSARRRQERDEICLIIRVMEKTDETVQESQAADGGGPGSTNRTRRGRVTILVAIVVVVLAALVSSQVTVFVVQPIGAVPEGRTVVMSRLATTKFIDSADAMCLRIQDGVSLLCRGMVLGQVLQSATIYLRLPYSRTLYLFSTDGAEYGR